MSNPLEIAQVMAQRIIQNRSNQGSLPPWGPEGLNAVLMGDSQKGEQIANQLLQTYGITKEQAFQIVNQRMQNMF